MAIRNANARRVQKAVFLIGNTGSGKSAVATELAADGFRLFQIDNYYQNAPRSDTSVEWVEDKNYRRHAYQAMRSDIRESLRAGRNIVIETTGASSYTTSLFKSLKRRKGLTTLVILVKVSLKTARARIRARNSSTYPIKCPPAFLDLADRVLQRPSLPIDFDVNGNASLRNVLREVRSILRRSNPDHVKRLGLKTRP